MSHESIAMFCKPGRKWKRKWKEDWELMLMLLMMDGKDYRVRGGNAGFFIHLDIDTIAFNIHADLTYNEALDECPSYHYLCNSMHSKAPFMSCDCSTVGI